MTPINHPTSGFLLKESLGSFPHSLPIAPGSFRPAAIPKCTQEITCCAVLVTREDLAKAPAQQVAGRPGKDGLQRVRSRGVSKVGHI